MLHTKNNRASHFSDDRAETMFVEGTLSDPQSTTADLRPFPRKRAYKYRQWRPNRAFTVGALLLFMVCLFGGVFSVRDLFLNEVVTSVVLTPRQEERTEDLSVTAVPPGSTQSPLQSILRPLLQQETDAKAVATTGSFTRPALAAQGQLTFFNSTVSQLLLPAGIEIVSVGGIHVKTLTPVTLPPANSPPQLSSAQVAASAIEPGVQGNLPPQSINTHCPVQFCGQSIIPVSNTTAFFGGQDAQTRQIVAQSDIDQAASTLLDPVRIQTRSALEKQIVESERLVGGTPACQAPQTNADPPVGTTATQVHVSVSITCTGDAYMPDDIKARAERQFQVTVSQTSPSFMQRIASTATMTSRMERDSAGRPVFHVLCWGKWSTEITGSLLSTLVHELAGKTPQEAEHYLLSNGRIASVHIEQHFAGTILLPLSFSLEADPRHLSITVSP